jgi:hypothetical protein
MRNSTRAFLAMGAMATVAAAAGGCVADRPSRNGVFNENQYLKKSFLIENGDGSQTDPGWFLKATVTSVSTPNPIGGLGIAPGYDGGAAFVRFRVTQDKLQMINVREIEQGNGVTNTQEVVNAWPVTNLDLKYRINLDGEKTNFYEENQELDWQMRQWVKVAWAKNDMSDVAPLGGFVTGALAKCTDLSSASATMVTDSFKVEENADASKNAMQWTINITVPLRYDDPACVQAYGGQGVVAGQFGRTNVSFDLRYSLMRAKPLDDQNAPDAYVPIVLDEKDPIRHKYGIFNVITTARDPDTKLLSARQLVNRWNPNKPITYYFSPDVPDMIKDSFLRPGGIKDLTNKMFEKAGAKARLEVLNWNDDKVFGDAKGPVRDYGDIRYSFVRWVAAQDAGTGYLGLGPNVADPRTGEILSGTVNLANFVGSELAYQIDFYLKGIGASQGLDSVDPKTGQPSEWTDLGACKDGDVAPLKNATLQAQHNGNSSLYAKMQQYLQKPAAQFGNLGAEDFVAKQDADFFKAYYTILPYQIFADPDMNPFVIREGGNGVYGPPAFWAMMTKEVEFQKIAASVDRGEFPFEGVTGPDGLKNATDFTNKLRELTINHTKLEQAKSSVFRQQFWDAPSAFNLVQIMNHAGRHCVNGKWETKTEWVDHLIRSFYDHVAIHEFGHNLGLQHNFMGSVDKQNWPVKLDANGNPAKDAVGNPIYSLYTSSQMEYNVRGADMMNTLQWGAYDLGALGWTYGNARNPGDDIPGPTTPRGDSISGQSSGATNFKAPWHDPMGFDAKGNETQFLYCHHEHLAYTPLCRTFDAGSTPSEIVANAIDQYEWNFNFTNYRVYRKFWDNSNYASGPANLIHDMRRFMSLWLFDWGSSELADTLRRVGLKNPDPNGSDLQYFAQLTDKFNKELSYANKMVAAFHKAVIQQSTGERPVRTVYDKYYGDVTQQGIILDKLFAMQGWVALWPSDNYDQNQAGSYISSYSYAPDPSYAYQAEDTVDSMIGGQYDAFPYFAPLAVATFAQDTHSPSFGGRVDIRNWIGGFVFDRLQDYLDFFRDLAVKNNVAGCTDIGSCKYDPRGLSDTHNEFVGPDKKQWIWAYIPNRNTWVAAQKDINTATYVIVRNYTDDVVYQLDDGAFPGGAYGNELPMKYYLDSFKQYN